MARPDSLETNRQRCAGRIYAAPLVYLSEQLILNTVLPGIYTVFSVRCTCTCLQCIYSLFCVLWMWEYFVIGRGLALTGYIYYIAGDKYCIPTALLKR